MNNLGFADPDPLRRNETAARMRLAAVLAALAALSFGLGELAAPGQAILAPAILALVSTLALTLTFGVAVRARRATEAVVVALGRVVDVVSARAALAAAFARCHPAAVVPRLPPAGLALTPRLAARPRLARA